jgi:HAD superfamily hydrolase (TIGR01509 family)
MSHNRKKAVIFDMDGLLIDSEPLWHQCETAVLHQIGVDTSYVTAEMSLGLRIDQVVEMHYRHSPWQGATIEDIVQRITDLTIEKIVELRPLMPGVTETLELARSLDFKIGLASASPLRLLDLVVELFDIKDYFDCITSAEYLPYSKPHPEVYLIAANTLDVSPLQTVTFEDSINGMIATKAAKMRSIVVPEKSMINDLRWSLADVKLNSLLEVNETHIL